MSKYYSSDIHKRKPEHDQDYQIAEQKFFAKTPQDQAIYSDQGLKDQWLDNQVSKTLRLQEMGMRKKEMDKSLDLRERGLEHSKSMSTQRHSLAKKSFKERKRQDRFSTYLGVGNMALSAGIGYFEWKNQQKLMRKLEDYAGMYRSARYEMGHLTDEERDSEGTQSWRRLERG